MTEKRKASVATRIYPETLDGLKALAKKHGVDCAAMLDILVTKARRK